MKKGRSDFGRTAPPRFVRLRHLFPGGGLAGRLLEDPELAIEFDVDPSLPEGRSESWREAVEEPLNLITCEGGVVQRVDVPTVAGLLLVATTSRGSFRYSRSFGPGVHDHTGCDDARKKGFPTRGTPFQVRLGERHYFLYRVGLSVWAVALT